MTFTADIRLHMPEAEYLEDPLWGQGGSLSHSGAKLILESPAKFKHNVIDGNRRQHKAAFDFGTAAHAEVLGVGNVTVLDFDDRRTKAYKEAEAEARAAGSTPVLVKDWAIVEAMAAEIRAHPLASQLFNPERGNPEVSLFWEADQIWKRARLDWMPDVPTDGSRMIVADYKTTGDGGAAVREFEKAVANYGYHSQAAFYSEGVLALTGVEPSFVFVVQEKDAPYAVNVIEPSPELLLIGAQRMERATSVYRECKETGVWPGYSEVDLALAKPWTTIEHAENLELWGMAS